MGKRQVQYAGTAEMMSDQEYQSRCSAVGARDAAHAASPARRPRRGRRRRHGARRGEGALQDHRLPSKRAASRSRRSRCARRSVTGSAQPPRLRRVTATLERAGRVYAVERDRRGGIRLTQRRTITPGRYRLFIREKVKRFVLRRNGRRLHTAEQHMTTIVPMTIRWTRRK